MQNVDAPKMDDEVTSICLAHLIRISDDWNLSSYPFLIILERIFFHLSYSVPNI